MSRTRSFLWYWLPVLVWMGVIFSASGDSSSFERSSRILGPLVRWLFPNLADHSVHAIVFYVRKLAHLTEYALLALLLWRALRQPGRGNWGWRWREPAQAALLVFLYAATDELHQHFVPTRQGSALDVLLDTVGGILGLLGLWALACWCAKARRRHQSLTPAPVNTPASQFKSESK